MPNTLSSTLVPDFVSPAVLTVANNKLAALRAFSRNFGTAPMAPRKKIEVALASAAGAAQTNPTNFETGDTTLDAVGVTVAQISRSFAVSNTEMNQGFLLAQLAEKNAHVFANAISDVWTALVTDAIFNATTPRNIGPVANFDSGTLADCYGDAKNFSQKNLVLDGAYAGRLVSTINPAAFQPAPGGGRGAFGFDDTAEQNRWTSADANTVGIVCSPDAIAVAAGLPIALPDGEVIEQSDIFMDGIGLTVRVTIWFSRASRTTWASYDVMFGAAAGDTSQLVRLKSS